ncbi:MAG: SRPBCC family protein [Bauldia sp.]
MEVSRIVKASPSEVYRAWTDLSSMGWMGDRLAADVRVGGAYRIETTTNGAEFVNTGTYRVLDTDRRIVMTFRGGPKDVVDGPATESPYKNETLEIRLRALDGGRTEVAFADRWDGEPLSAEDAEALRAAWERWLGKMAGAVEWPS